MSNGYPTTTHHIPRTYVSGHTLVRGREEGEDELLKVTKGMATSIDKIANSGHSPTGHVPHSNYSKASLKPLTFANT